MIDLELKMSKNIITEFKIGRDYISLEFIDEDKINHTVKYLIKEYKEKTRN